MAQTAAGRQITTYGRKVPSRDFPSRGLRGSEYLRSNRLGYATTTLGGGCKRASEIAVEADSSLG